MCLTSVLRRRAAAFLGGHRQNRRLLESRDRRRRPEPARALGRPRPGPVPTTRVRARPGGRGRRRTTPPAPRRVPPARPRRRGRAPPGARSGPSARTIAAASTSGPSAREPAAKRRAGALLPFGAPNRAGVRLDLVRAQHDDDLVDRAGGADALEHLAQEESLLRRAEPRRGARGEHDDGDHRRHRLGAAVELAPERRHVLGRTTSSRRSARRPPARPRSGPRCTRRARGRTSGTGRASGAGTVLRRARSSRARRP